MLHFQHFQIPHTKIFAFEWFVTPILNLQLESIMSELRKLHIFQSNEIQPLLFSFFLLAYDFGVILSNVVMVNDEITKCFWDNERISLSIFVELLTANDANESSLCIWWIWTRLNFVSFHRRFGENTRNPIRKSTFTKQNDQQTTNNLMYDIENCTSSRKQLWNFHRNDDDSIYSDCRVKKKRTQQISFTLFGEEKAWWRNDTKCGLSLCWSAHLFEHQWIRMAHRRKPYQQSLPIHRCDILHVFHLCKTLFTQWFFAIACADFFFIVDLMETIQIHLIRIFQRISTHCFSKFTLYFTLHKRKSAFSSAKESVENRMNHFISFLFSSKWPINTIHATKC